MDRRRVLSISAAVLLLGGVLVYSVVNSPAAHASTVYDPNTDPCGPAPTSYFDPGWITWSACEAGNGFFDGPGITSVFQGGFSYLGYVLLPNTGDFTPVFNAIQNLTTHQPFQFVGQVANDIGALRDQLENASSGGVQICDHSGPGPGECYFGWTSDYGVLSGGMSIWLNFLSLCGMSAGTIASMLDVFIVLAAAFAILRDIGLRVNWR